MNAKFLNQCKCSLQFLSRIVSQSIMQFDARWPHGATSTGAGVVNRGLPLRLPCRCIQLPRRESGLRYGIAPIPRDPTLRAAMAQLGPART